MKYLDFLPKDPHCSLICGATGCGKTRYVLDLLQTVYINHFEHIVIFCPTIKHNRTYKERKFIWSDQNIFIVNPSDRLNVCLEHYFDLFQNTPTLFIIDDCAAERDIVRKKSALAKLAFSGRHALISVWILTQKYNAVLKDFREQLKTITLFYSKDRDSFEECLRENDVIENKQERERIKNNLKSSKHSKLVLKTDQPVQYVCL